MYSTYVSSKPCEFILNYIILTIQLGKWLSEIYKLFQYYKSFKATDNGNDVKRSYYRFHFIYVCLGMIIFKIGFPKPWELSI